jgi:hypothetical protein
MSFKNDSIKRTSVKNMALFVFTLISNGSMKISGDCTGFI